MDITQTHFSLLAASQHASLAEVENSQSASSYSFVDDVGDNR